MRRVWLSTRLDTRTRQRVSPAGQHCSSFITLKLFVFRSGRIKAVRNDPKCHHSRLYRAVFVPMVAQPIQDLSAVSITDKTVGIRLPHLWCGAGLVPALRNHSKRVSSSFFPFVHGGSGWLRRSGVFESAKKTEQRLNG